MTGFCAMFCGANLSIDFYGICNSDWQVASKYCVAVVGLLV